MCETPSPVRTNRPVPSGPSRDLPHAGFSSAQPVGAGASTAQAGPTLSGWPRQLAWSDFRDIQSRPQGESEDARISIGFRPGHGRNGARQQAWERQIRTCRQSGAQLTVPS
ncbi:MAG: ferric iron reductase [Candidatus Thiodiazotropha sp. (ex Dulcina madagascariensis)]|nr:ferric iron reductase [Candidatus Thiodiazotropha sp. (ex Dulcina madagascariensis)]